MKDTKGCCGHPPSCTKAGRCKAYEEFNEAVMEQRDAIAEMKANQDFEARKANREAIRKRRERKASRPRRRGDTGRTMSL